MFATALAIFAIAATHPPACTHSQVQVGHGREDGTAGALHWPLTVRNVSGRACSLRGFPAVWAVSGRHGHRIGAPAKRDRAQAVRRVRLGKASALFTQTDVGVFDTATCRPRHASGVRVRLPGQTATFYVHLPHEVCSNRSFGSQATVRAFEP